MRELPRWTRPVLEEIITHSDRRIKFTLWVIRLLLASTGPAVVEVQENKSWPTTSLGRWLEFQWVQMLHVKDFSTSFFLQSRGCRFVFIFLGYLPETILPSSVHQVFFKRVACVWKRFGYSDDPQLLIMKEWADSLLSTDTLWINYTISVNGQLRIIHSTLLFVSWPAYLQQMTSLQSYLTLWF